MKIEFKNLYFNYIKDKFVLFDINTTFEGNKMIFIMGESGSGKSTLAQQINALLKPTKGSVNLTFNNNEYVLSNDIKEKRLKEIRRRCGFLFQFPENQLFETNVLEDVMFGPLNFGRDKDEAKKDAMKALEKVGIDKSFYERSPFNLSGGEKRKVAIAGVLAFNPSVLILDEPTSSLDSYSKSELMKLLVALKNQGIMVIIISHDENSCYEYADEVVVLKDGKILSKDTPENTFFNEKLIRNANLSLPFVVRILKKIGKNKSKAKKIRNISDLASFLRGDKHE